MGFVWFCKICLWLCYCFKCYFYVEFFYLLGYEYGREGGEEDEEDKIDDVVLVIFSFLILDLDDDFDMLKKL